MITFETANVPHFNRFHFSIFAFILIEMKTRRSIPKFFLFRNINCIFFINTLYAICLKIYYLKEKKKKKTEKSAEHSCDVRQDLACEILEGFNRVRLAHQHENTMFPIGLCRLSQKCGESALTRPRIVVYPCGGECRSRGETGFARHTASSRALVCVPDKRRRVSPRWRTRTNALITVAINLRKISGRSGYVTLGRSLAR